MDGTGIFRLFPADPERWAELNSRYAVEVHEHREQLGQLRVMARQGSVTLIFSAHDEVHNDAVVLRDFLLEPQVKQKLNTVLRAD